MTCPTCVYADEHGSWVDAIPGMTHCRRCHGTWSRTSPLQHCTACCRTFTTAAAADIHRRPSGCVDPSTIQDKHGRQKLAVSTRDRRPGTTVTVWAQADHTAGARFT